MAYLVKDHDDHQKRLRASTRGLASAMRKRLRFAFAALLTAAFLLAWHFELRHTLGRPTNSHRSSEFSDLPLSAPLPRLDTNDRPAPASHLSRCGGPSGPVAGLMHHTTPSSHPKPVVGSYDRVRVDPSKCMTYTERYAPYTDTALGTDYLDHYLVWLKRRASVESNDRVDSTASAPAAELAKTNAAAHLRRPSTYPAWRGYMDDCRLQASKDGRTRSAFVLRVYEKYTWSEDDILHVRALISELSLSDQEPIDVRLLLEVFDQSLAILSSERHRVEVLSRSIPREFWELTELWSEAQMETLYPALPGRFLNRMSACSSYRSCFMPLQRFSLDHPEYDFVWNWEMDTRYTGNYADLVRSSADFAKGEGVDKEMSRYKHWYVPQVSRSQQEWAADDNLETGAEADLIVFNPIFNPRASGWYWEHDIQNFPTGEQTDRRASLGRNARFSRALLRAMSALNAEEKKSTHCETWPATVVLHSNQAVWHDASIYGANATSSLAENMKAVYVPHPNYFRHRWSPDKLYALLSDPQIYRKVNEKVLRDASFYYDGGNALGLYTEWITVNDSCMAPALLHPVKNMYRHGL